MGELAGEVCALLVLLALYRWGRVLADGRHSRAREHAEQVWNLERVLHLPDERWLQDHLLDHPVLAQLANGYYASVHFPLTAAVLVLLHLRRRQVYRRLRNALVAATAASLLITFAYPLAPPRMMTALGFTDVAARHGQSVYSGIAEETSNQFAAMPSLHVGWAVLVACALSCAAAERPFRRRALRWLSWLHPAVTVLVVVATSNHFWLDGLVGTALVLTAWAWAVHHERRRAAVRNHPRRILPRPSSVGAPTADAVVTMTATGRRGAGPDGR